MLPMNFPSLRGCWGFSRILGSPDQSLLVGRGRGGFRAEPPWGFVGPSRAQESLCRDLGNIPSLQGHPPCTSAASECPSCPCVPAEMSPEGAGNHPGEVP